MKNKAYVRRLSQDCILVTIANAGVYARRSAKGLGPIHIVIGVDLSKDHLRS